MERNRSRVFVGAIRTKKNCKRFFNNIVHFYENGNSDITLRQMYDIVTKHEIGKIDMINDNEFYIKIYEDN